MRPETPVRAEYSTELRTGLKPVARFSANLYPERVDGAFRRRGFDCGDAANIIYRLFMLYCEILYRRFL
jgi:hypothetical protein